MRFSDRLASFFLVQGSERGQTAYFLLIFLLLGAGLAIGRGSADALFFKRFGIEYLPLMFVLFGVLLAIVSTTYAAYADRIPSERFFVYILIVLAVVLASAWLMMRGQVTSLIYPAYFLIFEVSSEILMMHALFYSSQNFETRQAKRLTPLIFAAAQLGRIIGGVVLSLGSGTLGVQNMVLLWILLCGVSVVLVVRRHRYIGVSPYYRSSRKGRNGIQHALEQIQQGLRFAQRSELLKAASFALFFLVASYYIASYAVNSIYTQTFRTEESLSSFFGLLTAVTAGAALLIQLFVTGRLLQRFGIKKVNLVFPITSVLSYLLLVISFTLPAALLASFNKDSLMTAIRNPTRNLLFNALPDYMQGRGRALLMAVVLPVAVVVTGSFLHSAQESGNTALILAVGFIASVIYLFCSVRINRAYVRTILETLKERVFLPEKLQGNTFKGGGEALLQELAAGVDHADAGIALAHASMLAREYPEQSLPIILNRVRRADAVLSQQLLKIIRHLDLTHYRETLHSLLENADDRFRLTLYSLLFACRDPAVESRIESLLDSDLPQARATGVEGVFTFQRADLYARANTAVRDLLQHPAADSVLAGLALLRRYPGQEHRALLPAVMEAQNPEIQKAALHVVCRWTDEPDGEWLQQIHTLSDSIDPGVRSASAKALGRYRDGQANDKLFALLEDRHPDVRNEAVNSLRTILPDDNTALLDWVLSNAGSPRAQQSILDGLNRGAIGVDVFVKVAETRLEDARRCRALLLLMLASDNSKNSAAELVTHTLRERIQQYTGVILSVMEYLENPSTLNIIRAGLQSGDPRQVANACEALSELKHQSLARGLETLYSADHGKSAKGRRWFTGPVDGLQWAAQNLDPWMRTVANRALATA